MTSHSSYGPNTTATEVALAFKDQIKGKTVVITGVSPNGIGAATALAIASQHPAALVLASRTQANLDAVVADIRAQHPTSSLTPATVLLDLSSLDSIRAAAERITSSSTASTSSSTTPASPCRPAMPSPPRRRRRRPAALHQPCRHFSPHLVAAAPHHRFGRRRSRRQPEQHGPPPLPIRFSDYAFQKDLYDGHTGDYPGFVGYGQSKTANVLHAWELTRRAHARGDAVLSLSVHPGTIVTGLTRSLDTEGRAAMDGTAPNGIPKTLDEGAATTLVAAFDPALAQGDVAAGPLFLADCQLAPEKMAPHGQDGAAAQRLWDETEKMLGIKCL
ncbi:unnamed protein product [Parascedosporium putredinis]|uniref:NAD(P)-binding protein n=1 Tax=Parascedosporium putredinis TaxID=1442378 RepID=A0A9P1GZZ5_9PEZI|nr:unnamed protein product [Parascedosporium putredinis]CAI7993437.1 unnamed protein product [Parascedosporium putredinis]